MEAHPVEMPWVWKKVNQKPKDQWSHHQYQIFCLEVHISSVFGLRIKAIIVSSFKFPLSGEDLGSRSLNVALE